MGVQHRERSSFCVGVNSMVFLVWEWGVADEGELRIVWAMKEKKGSSSQCRDPTRMCSSNNKRSLKKERKKNAPGRLWAVLRERWISAAESCWVRESAHIEAIPLAAWCVVQ